MSFFENGIVNGTGISLGKTFLHKGEIYDIMFSTYLSTDYRMHGVSDADIEHAQSMVLTKTNERYTLPVLANFHIDISKKDEVIKSFECTEYIDMNSKYQWELTRCTLSMLEDIIEKFQDDNLIVKFDENILELERYIVNINKDDEDKEEGYVKKLRFNCNENIICVRFEGAPEDTYNKLIKNIVDYIIYRSEVIDVDNVYKKALEEIFSKYSRIESGSLFIEANDIRKSFSEKFKDEEKINQLILEDYINNFVMWNILFITKYK